MIATFEICEHKKTQNQNQYSQVSLLLSLACLVLGAFIARPTHCTQTHAIIRYGTVKENNSDPNHGEIEYKVLQHIRTCTPIEQEQQQDKLHEHQKHFTFQTLPINKPKHFNVYHSLSKCLLRRAT